MAGYWTAGPPFGVQEELALADDLGFDSFWTAEAYGSDALTPLAWWGSTTKNIDLGTAIIQMAARTPAATAMAAMTMDHLTGGRFRLGLGASGPQVVEGWYGQAYPRPLARTREYVDIVRAIVARQERVTYDGEFFQLPVENGAGLGKALKSTIHPLRSEIPIYLGAEGPNNVALAAEICDGWLPFLFSPSQNDFYRAALDEGFSRASALRQAEDFDVAAVVPVIVNDDVDAGADVLRPMLSLYIGGMGAKNANFHHDVFVRMGYEQACKQIQDAYLGGDKQAAYQAVPTALVEDIALVGPPAKIRDDLAAWNESVVGTLLINGPPEIMRMMAEFVL